MESNNSKNIQIKVGQILKIAYFIRVRAITAATAPASVIAAVLIRQKFTL